MAKFRHRTLSLSSNVYPGATGNQYTFFRGFPTEVTEPNDIEHFRNHPDYEEVGILEQAKEVLKRKLPKRENLEKEIATIEGLKPEETKTLAEYFKHWDVFLDGATERELMRLTGMDYRRAAAIAKQITIMRDKKKE